jgi:hypothetical protein
MRSTGYISQYSYILPSRVSWAFYFSMECGISLACAGCLLTGLQRIYSGNIFSQIRENRFPICLFGGVIHPDLDGFSVDRSMRLAAIRSEFSRCRDRCPGCGCQTGLRSALQLLDLATHRMGLTRTSPRTECSCLQALGTTLRLCPLSGRGRGQRRCRLANLCATNGGGARK